MIDYAVLFKANPGVSDALPDIFKFFNDAIWMDEGLTGVRSSRVDYNAALEFAFRSNISKPKLKALLLWFVAPDLEGLLKSVGVKSDGMRLHSKQRMNVVRSTSGAYGHLLPKRLYEERLLGWSVDVLIDLLPHVSDKELLAVYRTLLVGIWHLRVSEGERPDSPLSTRILKAVPIFAVPPYDFQVYLGYVELTDLLGAVLSTASGGPFPQYVTDLLTRAISEARILDTTDSDRKASIELVASFVDCIEYGSLGDTGMIHLYRLILANGMSDHLFWLLAVRGENVAIQILNAIKGEPSLSDPDRDRYCQKLLAELDRLWGEEDVNWWTEKKDLVGLLLANSTHSDLHVAFTARLAEVKKLEQRRKRKEKESERRLLQLLSR